MRLIDRLRTDRAAPTGIDEQRSGLVGMYQTWQGRNPAESIEDDFPSYVRNGYKQNGVVFAVILARMALFTDVEFCYQALSDRRQYGLPTLGILEKPWPNGTTGELLARMEQDVSLTGNAYIYKAAAGHLQRLRPDWMTIVTDGTTPTGYLYSPNGPVLSSFSAPVPAPDAFFLKVEEVAHWSPIPDPIAPFRGMSWLTPVLGEVLADKGMTRHKQKFFENAATPNLLIKYQGQLDYESRQELRKQLEVRYESVENAYRTLVLDGGADATIIGSTMQAMSFDTIQAAGENRIAAAGGVPGIVVGLKEGLQAATYSNYAQAMRRFVDLFAFPQWRSVSVCLSKLAPAPPGSRLWFDTTHIAALKQDVKDQAEIIKMHSEAIMLLVRSGYDPEEVARFVATGEGLDTLK